MSPMSRTGEWGTSGSGGWLGVGIRLLATLLILLLTAAVNRCTVPGLPATVPVTTVPPTQETLPARPDLLVGYVAIELETGGACNYTSTQLGLSVLIKNVGQGATGPFVVEANGARQEVSGGLAAGETIRLWFEGYQYGGENRVTVDVDSQVQESDEGNNSFAQMVPIPTLPPTCTPPLTPSTPTPTATPMQVF